MEKLVYLVWKREADGIEPFRERLLERAAPKLLAEGALSLVANVADLHARIPPRHPLVVGDGREISACVSVWLESQDARPALEATLAGVASKVHGYLVTESVPLRCPDRTWPDGERSPGVTLWTAFPKPERLTDDAFFAHWYGSHTPLSFEIHPLWQYVRNAVARPLTPGAKPFRAIVEERFRSLDEILDYEAIAGTITANTADAAEGTKAFVEKRKALFKGQ